MRLLKTAIIAALGVAITAGASSWPAQADAETLVQKFNAEAPTTVHFNFNSASIDDKAAAIAAKQAKWLAANPRAEVLITGYADSVGSADYNQALGLERAKALEERLIELGVAADRIRPISSRGETQPVEAISGQSRKNRRAEIAVVDANYVSAKPCSSYRTVEIDPALDAAALRADMKTRRLEAEQVYLDQVRVATLNQVFSTAAHVKADCAAAEGYLKPGYSNRVEIVPTPIRQCLCYSRNLRALTSN